MGSLPHVRGASRLYGWARHRPWLYDQEHDSMWPGHRRTMHMILRGASRVSSVRYLVARPSWGQQSEPCHVNLGSGREGLPGWINVDINPFSRAQVWMDIRDPWPFGAESVEVIYSRHCFEHFNETELLSILRQCHRVLKPNHGLRIAVPSLEAALHVYANGGFPEWVNQRAKSAGRRFFLYITDNGNHGVILDFTYLAELLELTGFADIKQTGGGRTNLVDGSLLSALDCPEDVSTLYVEARKA